MCYSDWASATLIEECLELNAIAVAEEEKGERILSESKGNLVWELYWS